MVITNYVIRKRRVGEKVFPDKSTPSTHLVPSRQAILITGVPYLGWIIVLPSMPILKTKEIKAMS